MKKLCLIIFLSFILKPAVHAHPLHLSVTNIVIEGKELRISISTFVDDWETAYFHYNSEVIDLKIKENYMGYWFSGQLKKAFSISEKEGGEPVKLRVDKVSFEDLSMKIELQGQLNKAPKTLYFYNSILTDIFPDQTNLVIISLEGRQRGMKFDYKTKQKELNLR